MQLFFSLIRRLRILPEDVNLTLDTNRVEVIVGGATFFRCSPSFNGLIWKIGIKTYHSLASSLKGFSKIKGGDKRRGRSFDKKWKDKKRKLLLLLHVVRQFTSCKNMTQTDTYEMTNKLNCRL